MMNIIVEVQKKNILTNVDISNFKIYQKNRQMENIIKNSYLALRIEETTTTFLHSMKLETLKNIVLDMVQSEMLHS